MGLLILLINEKKTFKKASLILFDLREGDICSRGAKLDIITSASVSEKSDFSK